MLAPSPLGSERVVLGWGCCHAQNTPIFFSQIKSVLVVFPGPLDPAPSRGGSHSQLLGERETARASDSQRHGERLRASETALGERKGDLERTSWFVCGGGKL